MKNFRKLVLVDILAIFGIIISFIACDKDDGKNDPKLCNCPNGTEHNEPCTCDGEDCHCTVKVITREFIIVIEGKDFTVSVKDTRTGTNDTNLEELGIIVAFTTELNDQKGHPKFDEVYGRTGFTIFIEVTDEYEYYKTYNPTKVGINFEFVKNPGDLLPTAIGMIINAMVDGATYPQQI